MPISEGGTYQPNSRIVSPGVFTKEIDQSGIAQSVADIGAVIVAPFSRGPGFSPTLVRSVNELESKFGTADGTLYGAYTAKNYLQEKGFVTVCRVGALTGYHQKYPWVIWAERGKYVRNGNTGSFIQPTSIISQANLAVSTATETVISASISASRWGSSSLAESSIYWKTQATGSASGSVTGSVYFWNQPVTVYLSGSADQLYEGVSVSGTINGFVPITQSLALTASTSTSASILTAIIAENKFVGAFTTATFTSSQEPFDTSTIFYTHLSQSKDSCNNLTINISGSLRGLFGNYTNTFVSGSNISYDPCTGTWNASGNNVKVLAVLANTQWDSINTSLEAPGFLNSIQTNNPSPATLSSSVGIEYDLQLSHSENGGYGTYHFSLDPNSQKYITNVFGKNPQVGNQDDYGAGTKIESAYIYKIFEDDIADVAANPSDWKIHGDAMPSGSSETGWTGEPLNFTDQWSLDLLNGDSQYGLTCAYTPWVVSQQIAPWNGGSSTRFPLFKIWTLADGTYTNTSFKIEISQVKLAGTVAGSDYGTFTLTVRAYSDTDKKPKILEQFNNLNLDPTSANFIARRIGDRYNFIRFDGKIIEYGTYDNLSQNIRIEMTPNAYPVTVLPYGFQAYSVPVNGAIGMWCNPMAYTKASVYGLFPGKYPSGIDFGGYPAGADADLIGLYPSASTGEGHWQDNLQYFAPVPSGASIGSNAIFALDEEISASGVGVSTYISASNSVPAIYDAAKESTYIKMRKFVFGFQGGFDGQSPAIPLNIGADISAGNTQGLNCANSTTAGSIAYNQCIGALGNADEFDINMIITPGIIYSLHSYVTNLVVEMCEARGDCFYILDLYQDDGNPTSGQIDEVVSLASEFDTSYATAYYPWVKIKDTNINQIVTVPPSVVMPGVFASNDRVAAEWFAAAGLNRGGIPTAVQVTDRTTHVERDTLYEGRVNPIAAFPGQGICAWGQKTLQVQSSALDRINVRRLLIEIKKFFASTARYLVFEQNTAQTRNKFLAIVNPYLESVQQRSGLYAFQVIMDDSNNTPDLIDRNILYGQIYLKPTKTAEFIILDFNVLPTGASFPTA